MQTRKIGSLEVSIIGLGCNNFGRRIDAAKTREVVHAALDAGVNFFDTADIYGGTHSEELLGAALGGRRREAIVATKFGMEVAPDKKGAKPDYLRRAVEDSLRRLKTEVIDLYQLHRPDPETPIADTLGALAELVQAGKVRELGCSNFSVVQLEEARRATSPGDPRFVSLQNNYSMLHREPEAGVLEACKRDGLAFLPFFPLASGLLSGKYRRDRPHPKGTRIEPGEKQLNDATYELIEELEAWSAKREHNLLELAFAWLLAHEPVASVIAGATSAEQVRANAGAARWSLTAKERAQVDAILDRLGFRA